MEQRWNASDAVPGFLCHRKLRPMNWIFDIREYRYGKKISI